MKIITVSAEQLTREVSMAQAIQAVREAYCALSSGEAVMPQRTQIPVAGELGISLFMPAHLPRTGALGTKIVSVFPRNPQQGLPTIHALVVIVDGTTGVPRAILDGTSLTALRTGAGGGVATALLARRDARTAAVFGAGVQGRTQLRAVCDVRDVERAFVFDPDNRAARIFAEEMSSALTLDVVVARSPAEAAEDADIICTTTTSRTPVFEDSDLKPGVHINAIGSFTPEMQEIPVATVSRAKIVVDHVQSCLEEAGDLIIPLNLGRIAMENLQVEIGDVALGNHPGRETEEDLTLFKSVGLAVQDIAVAELALQRITASGQALEIEI